MTTNTERASAVETLGRDGAMTMLALDQRGSLRTMLAAGRDESTVSDDDIRAFKKTAIAVMSDIASAVLLDPDLGSDAIALLPSTTPLILSADVFEQPPGQFVLRSRVDDALTVERIHEIGASALKLLMIWKPNVDNEFRATEVAKFVDLARQAGVVSLLEGIVRTDDNNRYPDVESHGEAVLAAAEELAAFGPDVYKAEVPAYQPGQLDRVEEYARRITQALPMPWVVLSNGVEAADFAESVRHAVNGGASGFLAGRAIWADAAASDDPQGALESLSRGRLENLSNIVRVGQQSR
jgi:sulfofructosephosphate aldolase